MVQKVNTFPFFNWGCYLSCHQAPAYMPDCSYGTGTYLLLNGIREYSLHKKYVHFF